MFYNESFEPDPRSTTFIQEPRQHFQPLPWSKRSHVYNGEKDVYYIDVEPQSIFENRAIPLNIHNVSKGFRPNLATIRGLSLGTKIIPKWNTTGRKI